MKFPNPLVSGFLIKRYKRFLADIELSDGTLVTAHCANSGSLLTLKEPGSEVWISPVPAEKERKLRYDWHLIRQDDALVCINTSITNTLFEEALSEGSLPAFSSIKAWKREVNCTPKMRVDFVLHDRDQPFFVEIKSVTHHEGSFAMFPDSVTERGSKHLGELTQLVQNGARAAVVYIVQRNDKDLFTLASHIDPNYAHQAQAAKEQGVEFYCFSCNVSPQNVKIARELQMKA